MNKQEELLENFIFALYTPDNTTISITIEALGTDGIDIDVVVDTNKMTTKSPNSKFTPLSRAINIDAIAKNIAVPLVCKLTPSVNTKLEMRESLLFLSFIQCMVVGNVTALWVWSNKQKIKIKMKMKRGAKKLFLR